MDIMSDSFFVEMEASEHRYDEIVELLSAVEVMSDSRLFVSLIKEKKELEQSVQLYKEYKKLNNDQLANQELLSLATDSLEKQSILQDTECVAQKMQEVLTKLKCESSNSGFKELQRVKIEVSAKANAMGIVPILKEVFDNYFKLSQTKYEQIKLNGELGFVIGAEALGLHDKLKNLSGNYRFVVRGESADAIVVIIRELIQDEQIKEEDVVVQLSKSSGAGGQHINKTESAVRLVHKPTGISVECQDERSQLKNKTRAFEHLKEKIRSKNKENNEKYIKNQRNQLKNALFSETPEVIFDFDRNELSVKCNKKSYKLQDALSDFSLVINDL